MTQLHVVALTLSLTHTHAHAHTHPSPKRPMLLPDPGISQDDTGPLAAMEPQKSVPKTNLSFAFQSEHFRIVFSLKKEGNPALSNSVMNLQDMMLNERNHGKTDCMIPLV